MTFQDEIEFQKLLEMEEQTRDTEWIEQDLDDYPECHHPSLEDFF